MNKVIKSIAIITIFIGSFYSTAQAIISIEQAGTYLTNNGSLPSSSEEIRDLNNYFDPYIGSWQATHDNKDYFLTVYKKVEVLGSLNRTIESLSFSYLIKDSNTGEILADSAADELLGEAYGIKYQPASGFYEFFMYMDCGESKQVLLGFSPDTMELDGTITVDHHMVFVASNSTFHRPAGNGCQSYSHLIPDELILFERI